MKVFVYWRKMLLLFVRVLLFENLGSYANPKNPKSESNETTKYTGLFEYIYEQNTYVNAEKTFHFLPWHVEKLRTIRENEQSDTPIEFNALKSQLDQKNIVHLIERPLQVYYRDDRNLENDLKKYNNQLCKIKVSKSALYHTYDIEESVLDIVFVCSGWCCGLDCCHINLTLIVSICCVTLIILSIASYFSFRVIFKKPQVQAFFQTLGTGRKRREIRRIPAQRRVIKKSGIRQARLAFGDEEQILQPSRFIRPTARDPEIARSFKVSKIKRFSKILEETEDQMLTSGYLDCPKLQLGQSRSIPNLPMEYEYEL